MGDIIILRSAPVSLTSDVGRAFVTDLARASEGLVGDDELRDKYGLGIEAWRNSTKDRTLVRAVQAERDRRVLNGTAVREAAAKHFVKAPRILDQIMTDQYANPRHQIEAIRELRQTAAGDSSECQPETERFIIHIDLSAGGGPIETYDKSLAPTKSLIWDEHDGDE